MATLALPIMSANLHVIDHPLIRVRLSRMRDSTTPPAPFREHLNAVGRLMAFDVTRDLAMNDVEMRTPMESFTGQTLARPLVIVPVLRAGLGMAEGLQQMFPDVSVGHIGIRRNEETLQPERYYCKLPPETPVADVLLVDPMLATGGTAIEAVRLLLENGATRLRFVNLVSAPEGIEAFHSAHPGIPIYTAAVDRGLNEHGYIVPGLGDAGDRYFGTL